MQGEKLRPRNDWNRWVLPSSVQYSSPHAVQTSGSDALTQHFQSITLDENNATEHRNAEAYLTRSSSEVSSTSQQSGNTGSFTSQGQ